LSPYSDGEKGAAIADFANHQGCQVGAEVAANPLLPVTIRGEVPGRAMRGGAGVRKREMRARSHPLPAPASFGPMTMMVGSAVSSFFVAALT
ncbi:hypothetical protein EOB77_34945, partial [Mesorhizobium sp. M7A.F.Ca.MR.228.00.0.0]